MLQNSGWRPEHAKQYEILLERLVREKLSGADIEPRSSVVYRSYMIRFSLPDRVSCFLEYSPTLSTLLVFTERVDTTFPSTLISLLQKLFPFSRYRIGETLGVDGHHYFENIPDGQFRQIIAALAS